MTKTDSLKKWSDACPVVQIGPTYVRDGNWTTLDRALRHCADTSTIDESEGALNGDTVVVVTPASKEVAQGKSPMSMPPFLLVVK